MGEQFPIDKKYTQAESEPDYIEQERSTPLPIDPDMSLSPDQMEAVMTEYAKRHLEHPRPDTGPLPPLPPTQDNQQAA